MAGLRWQVKFNAISARDRSGTIWKSDRPIIAGNLLNEMLVKVDVTKTEAEAEVQPDGMADDVRRKPVTLERDRFHEIRS
jgi:hypothetical protein